MRKNLVVGILKEEKNHRERRAPLTPSDVKWLVNREIDVEIESNPDRVFADDEYRKSGGKVLDRFNRASLLVGIKEPPTDKIQRDKVYMIFSHTIKGQPHNMPLLKRFVENDVTLIDYEKIVDTHGRRVVSFGRIAGICGVVDSLFYLGKKLKWKGIDNPFTSLKPSWKYRSLERLKQDMEKIGRIIQDKGFDSRLAPFIIGITGHGNVSKGVQEALESLSPVEIHPRDISNFIRYRKYARNEIYKIVFLREEKFRARNEKGFYFEEYIEHPDSFESNLDGYLAHLNMLIHASYWDGRYPRMVTKAMIKKLYRNKDFRLEFIGDISCDVNGSIEITHKTTTQDNPIFTYDPEKDTYADGYEFDGITVLAIDNLPAELPEDSSGYFSTLIRDYVYQIAVHGVKDITKHVAIPRELRQAVIAEEGKLAESYQYLKKHIT